MKQNGSTITLLSLFIVTFWSCVSRPDEIVTTLQRAESCMEMYPDSAWHLLSGISDPDDLSDKKRADYVLLLTQARDKNYMDMSVDSSITFAVDYFKKNGNKRKYGKALYYYGRVLQGKRETSRAMKTFLDARHILEKTEEYKIMGLLLTDISILNREQSLYDEAINTCRLAIVYYYRAKDTLGVAYTYQTMGSSFFLKQEMDSVYQCATKSLQLLSDNPVLLRIGASKMLGMMYSFQKEYLKAEEIFLKIIDEEPREDRLTMHYMSLGRLYQLMGQKELAEEYLKCCLDSRSLFTRSDAYACLAGLAKTRHDYEQALTLKEKSDSLLYIAENEKKREDLMRLQTGYQRERLEKEKLQIKLENRILQLGSIVVSILFLGVTYYFYNRYWRAKLQIKQIEKSLEKNNRQIAVFLNEINRYKQQDDEKTKETDSKVRDLTYQINRLAQENVELRSKVDVSELMKILKNGTVIAEKLTSKEWDKIFNLANCLHADLLVKLKEEHNQLTKHDIELLAFILLGFTSKELMVVFDSKDIRTVFKAKSRLKERLRLKKEESLDEFLQKMQES